MSLDTIVVFVLVACAVFFMGRHVYRSARSKSCSCGCDCGCGGKKKCPTVKN